MTYSMMAGNDKVFDSGRGSRIKTRSQSLTLRSDSTSKNVASQSPFQNQHKTRTQRIPHSLTRSSTMQ